jgi:hypothetical protein
MAYGVSHESLRQARDDADPVDCGFIRTTTSCRGDCGVQEERMSARATQLADQTDDVIAQTIAFVEGVPDAKWTAFCEPEQCTVAALASHIAGSATGVLNFLVKPVVEGAPLPPITPDQIHAGNAENARKNAQRAKSDVVAELQANGAAASAYVRGLSDDQLQRSAVLFFSPDPVTADFIIENVIVNHSLGHLESMRASVQ